MQASNARWEKISYEARVRTQYEWAPGKYRNTTRSKTFFGYLHTSNKNADGTVKTRDQIMAELKTEAEAWATMMRRQLAPAKGSRILTSRETV
jgi:hypothetical protein